MAPPVNQKTGETSGELVPSTSHQAFNTSDSQSMVPGLSQATINDLITAFGGMIRQEMQRFEQRFEQRLERIEQFLGPALYQNPTSSPNPTSPLNSTLPSIEIPQQNLSHTNDSSYHTNPGHLRAEEMGYFDLQQANVEKITEKNKSTGIGSPIQAGTLSTIPHQATMQDCGDPSPRLNSAPLSTSPLAFLLASQLASPLGYIRYAKDMEA